MTFGHEYSSSFAQFIIPESEKDVLATENDISLFFRTRESKGLLFYLGGSESESPENQTYITANMGHSEIRTRVKLSDSEQSFSVQGNFADGEQHFLHINRTYSRLSVQVDSQGQEFVIVDTYPLHPEYFFFGGLPNELSTDGSTRRRRRRETADGLPIKADDFHGTMQDVRANDHLLQFFPLNMTDLPPSYDPPHMQNITVGEQSDDVCLLQEPCDNNSTCYVVFFNDFRYVHDAAALLHTMYKGRNYWGFFLLALIYLVFSSIYIPTLMCKCVYNNCDGDSIV